MDRAIQTGLEAIASPAGIVLGIGLEPVGSNNALLLLIFQVVSDFFY